MSMSSSYDDSLSNPANIGDMGLSGRSRDGYRLAQFGAAAIFAVAVALVPVVGRSASPPPIKIAVFDFEFEDLSPPAVLLQKPTDSATTMEKASSAAREELTHSGRYTVIDASKVDAKPVAEKTLRDCNGCEAALAEQLGAQQSMVGLVRKVTETDYYVVVRIRDAHTGKILDQEEAMFAGDQTGWPSGVRMLIRHQVLPTQPAQN
jgi:hypothetical protein